MVLEGTIITLTLMVLGFVFRQSKGVAVLQLVWLWIVTGFTTGGIDYDGNYAIYLYMSNANSKIGINEWLANLIGSFVQNTWQWDYWKYNAFLVAICMMVLFVLALKNTKNIALFFSMFMIYPFIDSVIQKRFFYCFVFSIVALMCAKEKKYKHCALVILIAIGFHFSAIMVLPFLFMDFFIKKHPRLIGLILVVEVYVITFQRGLFSIILNSSSAKVSTYMTSNISFKAGLLYILIQITFVILTLLIENDEFSTNILKNARENYIMRINIFSLIFLPLLMMDSTFFRFYRIIMVVSYFFLSDKVEGRFCINTLRYYLIWIYIVFLIVFQVVTINAGAFEWKDFLDTLFRYNLILGGK